MNRATPQTRDFARRLIACEAGRNGSIDTKTRASFPVPEKLRQHLKTVMGIGGFRSLFARALALAGAEVPALGALEVKADGSLGGMEALQERLDSQEMFECRVVLLAHLLGLLDTFIGESLTLRVVSEIWPKVSTNPLVSDRGGKYEKTK